MADGGLVDINSLSVAAFSRGGEAGELYESLEDILADVPLQDDEQKEWEQEIPIRELTRRLNETVDRYRAGRASEADLRQFFPNYSDYDIANAFGMTDTSQSGQRSESLVQPFLNSQSYNRAVDQARLEDYKVDRDIRQKSPNIYPYNRDFTLQLQELAEGGEVKEEATYTEAEIARMREAMQMGQPQQKEQRSPTQQAVKRIIPKSTAQGPQQKSSLARQQLYALPPYPLDMTGKLGQAGPIKRAEGSPEYGEIAEQMTVGTPLPTDQGPSLASQGLNLLKQAGQTVYGNLREAVTDPVAFNKRALGNVAQQLQSDPQEFIMNWTGGGLGGVIKPKGGVFPKAGTGSGIDNYLENVQESLARNAEGDLTIGQIKSINKFIEDKGRKYLTTTYGTGDDVLKEALLEGRLPAFGTDKKTFREYLLREARSGNPEALQDFERLYDARSGIGQFVVTPSELDAAYKIRDTAASKMLEKIKNEGVQEELITDPYLRRTEIEDMLREFSPEYQKNLARNLMNRELGMNRPVDVTDETLIRAAQQGEVFYDIPATPSLDFLDPRNLAKSLATLNPDKLNNMSFAEAVVQGTKNTKLQRDWDEVIKKVEGNKSIPKELYDIGTERVKPMGEDRWVRLTTAQAVQLEGASMHHSIGGYAKKGGYGVGGLDALLSGKAQLFSLRGKDGRPRITIEAQKNEDGTLLIRQIKGNFNGVPEPQDQEIVVEFLKGLPIDKIQPESYAKSTTGEELAERVRIDWSDKAGFGARSIF
jgi:hypothetical protein